MPEQGLRVLLITDVFPPGSGGSGWSAFYLGKALMQAGHRVLVLRPIYGDATKPALRRTAFRGVPVEEITAPKAPAWAARMKLAKVVSQRRAGALLERRAVTLARRGGFNVLHGQHAVSGVAASRAAGRARKEGLRVVSVCTVRDYWPLCPSSTRLFEQAGTFSECTECHHLLAYLRCSTGHGLRRGIRVPLSVGRWINTLLAGRSLAGCDAVVAVSGYVERELERSCRVRGGKIHAIPNLVDLPSVDAALAGPWPLHDISPKDAYLLFAGKLEVNKGAWLLPELIERAGVRLPVVIAGDGPLRGEIESAARGRQLDFRFYDWLDNDAVLRLMQGARALLFPSAWQEPLSRVLLEGCAAGAAIVALDTGGTSDVIEHGVSGWLAGSLGDFAEGIRAVVADDTLNMQLREGARRRAESRFAAPIVSARVLDLYKALLGSDKERAG